MAGHHISKLRIFDLRQQAPRPENEARRLQIDFGPFNQAERLNVVLIGAVAAFMVGLALWGFMTMTILAGVDNLLGESEPSQSIAEASEAAVFDCADFGAVRALSTEDEARFQAQCGAVAPAAQPAAESPLPTSVTTSPAATADNRANCDEIRGTDYRSDGERTWYLANCVSN